MPRKSYLDVIKQQYGNMLKKNSAEPVALNQTSIEWFKCLMRGVVADSYLPLNYDSEHVRCFISGYKDREGRRAANFDQAVGYTRLLKLTAIPQILLKSLQVGSFVAIDKGVRIIDFRHKTTVARGLKAVVSVPFLLGELLVTRPIAKVGDVVDTHIGIQWKKSKWKNWFSSIPTSTPTPPTLMTEASTSNPDQEVLVSASEVNSTGRIQRILEDRFVKPITDLSVHQVESNVHIQFPASCALFSPMCSEGVPATPMPSVDEHVSSTLSFR